MATETVSKRALLKPLVLVGVLAAVVLLSGGRSAQAQPAACSWVESEEGALSLCISTDKQTYVEGETVTMTLAVTNEGGGPITLVFPSSCTADFFVDGAWLFQACLMIMIEVPLQPGESFETSRQWDQRDDSGNQVAPGPYLVWGVSNHLDCFGFFGFCSTPPVAISIVSDVTEVEINIKPGGEPNSINLSSRGVIPVAILSTNPFDATTVDPATVDFESASPLRSAQEDVDTDGDTDLIMHFRTQATNIADNAVEACLTGETFGEEQIEGCNSVRIVGPEADADGDSLGLGLPRIFGDDVEATLGTDQFAACGDNAWPPDLNGDHVVDITDLGTMVNAGLFHPSIGKERFDLFVDGVIDISDLGTVTNFLFSSCQSPP